MHIIAPKVFTFTGLFVGRVYCIEDSDGLSLIDTGMPFAAKRIVAQLNAAEHAITDVKRILITHAHPDHIGGLPELQRLSRAPVIASAIEQPVIEGRQPGKRPDPRTLRGFARYMPIGSFKVTPVEVMRAVQGGDTLADVLGGLQVIAAPGHAPGHIAFWQPERRIAFIGDVLFNAPTLRLPLAAATVDMAENIRSIGIVARLKPEIVCFGHGAPLTHDASVKLEAFARKVGA